MIRVSKHIISDANNIKINKINKLFTEYELCLIGYVDLIISGKLPLKTNLSSKELPVINITHSRYKQLIYKQASEIVRSNYKKSNNKRYHHYKKLYAYMKVNHPNSKFVKLKYSELNLKDLVKSKYFIKPNAKNITINLDERFFDIEAGYHFDNYVKIILPEFNETSTRALQVKVPLKHHKHSNTLKTEGFTIKNTIQLKQINDKIFINLIWEKNITIITSGNKTLGIDIGYKKLITTSEGDTFGVNMEKLYNSISNKKQGSKNFKQTLIHRDNEINRIINQLDLTGVKTLIIEDLNNVKHNSNGKINKKFNNKLQRWSYRKAIDKLTRLAEQRGINLVKVSPTYTSQTCSSCGNIDKKSRKGEMYECISCGYKNDADINASINIHNRGVYSLSDEKKDKCHNLS